MMVSSTVLPSESPAFAFRDTKPGPLGCCTSATARSPKRRTRTGCQVAPSSNDTCTLSVRLCPADEPAWRCTSIGIAYSVFAGALLVASSRGENRIADSGSACGWSPSTCPDRNVHATLVAVDSRKGATRVVCVSTRYWPAAAGTVNWSPGNCDWPTLVPSLNTVMLAVSTWLLPACPAPSLYSGGAMIMLSPERVAHRNGAGGAGNAGPNTPWFHDSWTVCPARYVVGGDSTSLMGSAIGNGIPGIVVSTVCSISPLHCTPQSVLYSSVRLAGRSYGKPTEKPPPTSPSCANATFSP